MSALAMILTAALAVPGDGPEKPSMEMVQEQRLNLKGPWKAVVYGHGRVIKGQASVRDGSLEVVCRQNQADCIRAWGEPVDEGGGKLQMGGLPGIYKQDGDRLVICVTCTDLKRPTSFQAGKGQTLIILHRVKSRK